MARVEDVPSDEEDEPEVIIEDDAAEPEEIDNESDEGSDDLSDADDAERALESEAAELEEQIQKDPYDYSVHIQLINTLDKLSELERMRIAFERLHKLYSLLPEHWLTWVKMEAAIAHTPAEREQVHKLYVRATAEIYSIPLYTQWLAFAMAGDAQETHAWSERIMRRAGYDAVASPELWRTLADFEKLQLDMLREDGEEIAEQVGRAARCLASQLTRPLLDVEPAADELRDLVYKYGAHLPQDYLDRTLQQHERLKGVREKISVYENRLQVAEAEEKQEIFEEYIVALRSLQEEDGDRETPFNVDEMCAALYDRGTYECATDSLFAGYSELAASLPTEERARVLEVCVTRRPAVAQYWTLTMQHLERQQRDFIEIKETLEKALDACGKMSSGDSWTLWTTYLECLRRYTDFGDAEQCDNLRKHMRHACDSLHEMYSEKADTDCTIMMFWARLEYRRLGDPARGREIIEELFLNADNKAISTNWLTLIELEAGRVPRPPDKKLRDMFRRAVKFTTDYPPVVCERWIDFERDYGTLDSLLQCRHTCQEAMSKWYKRFETEDDKSNKNTKKGQKQKKKSEKANGKRKNADEERRVDDKKTDDKVTNTNGKKNAGKGKKRSAETEDGETEGAKRKKDEVIQNGVKRSRDDAEDEAAESKRQRLSGVGEGAAAAAGAAGVSGTHRDSSSERPSADKEACTLFVSNLDFKFDEASLRKLLCQWGAVATMRVVRGVKAFGGSICYCEYTNQSAVDEAVRHDRTPLDGRPVFLSRYRAERDKAARKFRYATVPERNKLFVRNLPFSHCTPERLREVFAPYGKLADVRAVTYKDGRPKGLAYVEYEDEKSAAAALQQTDNLLLDERHIQVAFSAPPARDIPSALSVAASLGQGRRDVAGTRRTQLSSFVPRVLQKPTAAHAASSPAPGTSSAPDKPKSNSDFRDMLLGNK